MKTVRFEDLVSGLQAVGIQPGDGLLVHSALQFLGRPEGGVAMYLEAILGVIGPQGTLAVPTFNFGFARGQPYDPENTPAEGMGTFSEYVRRLPQARRTLHPMQSLAVLGYWADDLAERDTPAAFDPGSAFDRMLELDQSGQAPFKLLLLGADISAASIFHLPEQRCQVPYRYWKTFTGPVRVKRPDGSRVWETRSYKMYVRDLELNPVLTAQPVLERLQMLGQWRSYPLNYGALSTCRLRDFVAAVEFFLRADPWSLVQRVSSPQSPDSKGSSA